MIADRPDDHEPLTPFRVLLNDATVAWLMEVADLSHSSPCDVIAAIVQDVARDDRRAHAEAAPDGVTLQ